MSGKGESSKDDRKGALQSEKHIRLSISKSIPSEPYVMSEEVKKEVFANLRQKTMIPRLDSFSSISMSDVSEDREFDEETLMGDHSEMNEESLIHPQQIKEEQSDAEDILTDNEERDFNATDEEKEVENDQEDDSVSEEDIDKAPVYSSSSDSEDDDDNTKLNVPDLNTHRLSFIMQEKLHLFVKNVRKRTTEVREEVIKELSSDEEDLKSVAGVEEQASLADLLGFTEPELKSKGFASMIFKDSIDSQSRLYLCWLILLVTAFLYNCFVIPMRSSYPFQTPSNIIYWKFADYICDFIYAVDMFYIKPRLSFMEEGLTITKFRRTANNYIHSWTFVFDLLSLFPTDIGFLFMEQPFSMLRINRAFKYPSYSALFIILDNTVSSPYAVRIIKTFSYMIYIIHCNSCVYYTISAYQGFGQLAYRMKGKFYLNRWVYNNQENAYIRCFYFTAAVATSTGNNPAPTNVIEYIYMTGSWMMGVFVFALLLGQIRDIVSNANKNKESYRVNMDLALVICKNMNLKPETQAKVKAWFRYTWEQQKTLDERKLVDKLPLKLQADLALSVHYNTLMKVALFQNCERALLRELVLKLKAVIFLPGDLVCKKGDVGKEMYIINNGFLEVIGGENNEIVFATMAVGTVFGEISLMAIGGNNRRTATIRSKGYSTLFVLSKEDLNEAIKDYPEAQRLLKKKAKQMLKKDQKAKVKNTEEVEKKRMEEKCKVTTEIKTPKMFTTIANAVRPGSAISKRMAEVLETDKVEKKNRHWSTLQSDSDLSDLDMPLPINDGDMRNIKSPLTVKK
uniref:Cyclic nucleotide-binding domain-containing protein n=1 Tax=Rhabditophanes sp. KR3021 TaxID=114890 RepID=A0AC35TX41_9BILA